MLTFRFRHLRPTKTPKLRGVRIGGHNLTLLKFRPNGCSRAKLRIKRYFEFIVGIFMCGRFISKTRSPNIALCLPIWRIGRLSPIISHHIENKLCLHGPEYVQIKLHSGANGLRCQNRHKTDITHNLWAFLSIVQLGLIKRSTNLCVCLQLR